MIETEFDTILREWPPERVDELIASRTEADVDKALRHGTEMNLASFAALVSPAAEPFTERIAQAAHNLTRQRFGATMQLYAPLYLSNECDNACRYCGFSRSHKISRTTLQPDVIEAEARKLHELGFRQVLLLTGEAPGRVGVDYLEQAAAICLPLTPALSIEVWPLAGDEYARLIAAGVSGVTVYQETYHRPTYEKMHPSGRKADYDFRLGAPARAGEAGMRRINIGALLGLCPDWRRDAVWTALHAQYLVKRFWRTQVSVSFPRLRPMVAEFESACIVNDADLVHYACAMRLFGPDMGLVLSTREDAELRNQLIHLGFTQMSAQSSTRPGGYGEGAEATEQFSISDSRSLAEILELLDRNGLDPVLKDWDETPIIQH